MKKFLFVDPGSKSTGWALFVDGEYVKSGTIRPKGKNIFERLVSLWHEYTELGKNLEPNEIHIERMNYRTHYYCTWSAGLIGGALVQCKPDYLDEDISPGAWQKSVEWGRGQEPLERFKPEVKSLDELAAIGMGVHWFLKKESV